MRASHYLVLIICLFWTAPLFAEDYSATINSFKKVDSLQPYFKGAYGYAVFPTIGKGGFGIGGAYGKGQVYQGEKLTGEASMKQLSIGLQVGGQAYSQIIFFQNKEAYDEFTSGSFEFGAEASAVAVNASAQAKAGSTGTSAGAGAGDSQKQSGGAYVDGMAVFIDGKGGLMYEASIGGQKFSFKPL